MEKEAIGFKVHWSGAKIALMIVGGIAIIIGAILLFLFVIGGVIGGGIAGGLIGGAVMFIIMPIQVKGLPEELVHIDGQMLYFPKRSIALADIQNVEIGRNGITITPRYERRFAQGYISNMEECANRIRQAVHSQPVQEAPTDINPPDDTNSSQ